MEQGVGGSNPRAKFKSSNAYDFGLDLAQQVHNLLRRLCSSQTLARPHHLGSCKAPTRTGQSQPNKFIVSSDNISSLQSNNPFGGTSFRGFLRFGVCSRLD